MHHRTGTFRLLLSALFFVLVPVRPTPHDSRPPARAGYVVDSTGDATDGDTTDGICDTGNATDGFTGLCTLRAAIMESNTGAGPNTIGFALGAGVPTIVTTGLPEVTTPVVIDGATGGADRVEIEGSVGSGSGMTVSAGSTTLKNLILHSFGGSALVFTTGEDNIVEHVWTGIDADGLSAPNGTFGLFMESGGHFIGCDDKPCNLLDGVSMFFSGGITIKNNYIGIGEDGTATGSGAGVSLFGASFNTLESNVISGNGENGISLLSGAAVNIISGNFIGTDPTGMMAVPNAVDGIHVAGSTGNTLIDNVISGNGTVGGMRRSECDGFGTCDGVDLRDGSTGNVLTGNHIGTDLGDAMALGNGDHGVFISSAPGNTIGGDTTPDRNIISGNGKDGIHIEMTEAANTIEGNYIGTDGTGTMPLGNTLYGINITEALGTIIGGMADIPPGMPCTGVCNVISGNGAGGVFLDRLTAGTTLANNFIGVSETGMDPVPNMGDGIFIRGATDNLVGTDNIIAFNGGDGIRLVDITDTEFLSSDRNSIRANTIFENSGLGIDLGGEGVTPNDNIFSDGPNDFQPFPVLTSARIAPDSMSTVLNGFLEAEDATVYGLDIFGNLAPDASGFGEGQIFLGGMDVTTSDSGLVSFTFTAPGAVHFVSATATDPDGNTSEFAQIPSGLIVTMLDDFVDSSLTDGVCDTSTTEPGDQCTLRAAIEQANFNANEDDMPDVITFKVPGCGGACRIRPALPLPAITDPVVIDGTTQSGARCDAWPPSLIIELTGDFLFDADGLKIETDGSTVRGLVINEHGEGSGISLTGDDNTVQCNFIGTNLTGSAALGNKYGVTVTGSGNLIGGPTAKERNLISGNAEAGVWVRTFFGAFLENEIVSNLIGTDVGGTKAVGNGWDGIYVDVDNPPVKIGDAASAPGFAPGNVISGNGTGTSDVTRGNGIRIDGDGVIIRGNGIGIAEPVSAKASGTAEALGNTRNGVLIHGGSDNVVGNAVGESGTANANAIAFNGESGVRVAEAGAGNAVRTNAIYSNGGAGIDLGGDGVTANDAGDGDTGANTLLNFPELSGLIREETGGLSADIDLDTDLAGRGHATATVELFENAACDASGNGEGAVFREAVPVTVGADGLIHLNHTLTGVPECRFLTATVTDPDGNTSEFSACAVVKSECLHIVETQFWHQPPGAEEAFETRTTTDGNRMRVVNLIENIAGSALSADLTIREEKGDRLLNPEKEPFTFPPTFTTETEHFWDTAGYAWSTLSQPQSDRTVKVELTETKADGTVAVVDTLDTDVTVKPRPVVLVHGLWSNADTWSAFETFFTDFRDDWVVGAVGDNKDLSGRMMDTGKIPSVGGGPFALSLVNTTATIADNAGVLEGYIEAIREDEEATHVDLVAHSMGGLISRYYIDRSMPGPPEGDPHPVVANLVMLGTPNLGSPCADLYMTLLAKPREYLTSFAGKIPAVGPIAEELLNEAGEALEMTAATNLYQLTPGYMRETFNREITDQRDVPFYISAGVAVPATCTLIGESDGVVPIESALARGSGVPVFTKTGTAALLHTDMTHNEGQSFDFAKQNLDQNPDDFSVAKTARFSGLDISSAPVAGPQMIDVGVVPVLPGTGTPVEIPVPAATVLGVTLMGSGLVRSVLKDPAGLPVDTVDTRSGRADLFRTQFVDEPAEGTWTLELTHDLAEDTLFVPIALWAYGTTLRLNLAIDTPESDGRIPLRAWFTDGDTPVVGTGFLARVSLTSGAAVSDFDLFDDGAHGDDDAGDGVFGGTSDALTSGVFNVGVWATFGEQVRGASQRIDLTDVVAGTGIDLALAADVPEAATTGEPLTYTFTVDNNGPESATGLTLSHALPEALAFDSATPSQGSCAEDTGTVTCALGTLDAGASATIDLIANATEAGTVTTAASVSAAETDWNQSNNTASGQTDVALGTATDGEEAPPETHRLYPNYPNPFSRATTIRFDVKETARVVLVVYDLLGRRVRTLAGDTRAPGRYSVTFDAGTLPSGLYLYRLRVGAFSDVRQMMLVR